MADCDYSRDALRLLYAVGAYSNPNGDFSRQLWLKLHSICVLALLGVKSGAFENYDVAPALFPFRGIKMFAMISQEAIEDIQIFFRNHMVDKILLNTWFYSTITGVAVTPEGQEMINQCVTDEDRNVMNKIIYCSKCLSPVDFAVVKQEEPRVHLVMNRVCRCQTGGAHTKDDCWTCGAGKSAERVDEFFSIGQVGYKAEPFFMDTMI